jgi:hypothetical protein
MIFVIVSVFSLQNEIFRDFLSFIFFIWWGAFRVADCCTFQPGNAIVSLLGPNFLCWNQKMGKFGPFWGKNGKCWSFSVKNGRLWPFVVPRKVAFPENYFDRRVPQKRARRDEQHGHKLLQYNHTKEKRNRKSGFVTLLRILS